MSGGFSANAGGTIINGGHSGIGLITCYEMAAMGSKTIIAVSKAGRVPVGGYEEYLVENIQELSTHIDTRADLCDMAAFWDIFRMCSPHGMAPTFEDYNAPVNHQVPEEQQVSVDAFHFLDELQAALSSVIDAGQVMSWGSLQQVIWFAKKTKEEIAVAEKKLKRLDKEDQRNKDEAAKRLEVMKIKVKQLEELIHTVVDMGKKSPAFMGNEDAMPESLSGSKQEVDLSMKQSVLMEMLREMDDKIEADPGSGQGEAAQAPQPQEPLPIFETCERCSGTIATKNSTSPLCEQCLSQSAATKMETYKNRFLEESKLIRSALNEAQDSASEKATRENLRAAMSEQEQKLMAERIARKEAERRLLEEKERQERQAREEAERAAREQAQREEHERALMAKEEKLMRDHARALIREKEEAKRKAKEEAARLAREEAERKALDDWVCPAGHAMVTFSVLDDGYPCDECDKDASKGDEFWSCRAADCHGTYLCDYSICADCKASRKRRDLRAQGHNV